MNSKALSILLLSGALALTAACGKQDQPAKPADASATSGVIPQAGQEASAAATTPAPPASPARTDEISASFPTLKLLTVKDIGVDDHGVKVYFAPALSQALNGKHPQEQEYDEGGVIVHRVLRSELLGAGKGYFIVDCDSGPSGDPSCTFSKEGEEKGTSISGLNFILPGNGNIYATGHTNTMFNQRRKYEWRGGEFVEVKQPFLYVGLDTTTNRAIQIYESRQYKRTVASLPANSPVSVVLNEGDDYLLKTPFGLVGWIKIENGGIDQDGQPIKGIYFRGD